MFTVLSNARNLNLYLAAALAIAIVVLLSFAVGPAISAPQTLSNPATSLSEAGSDYYQRHPELRVSAPILVDPTGDFYLRHPEWKIAPVILNSEASAYFQRHPELSAAGVATLLAGSLERPGMACESPVDCR